MNLVCRLYCVTDRMEIVDSNLRANLNVYLEGRFHGSIKNNSHSVPRLLDCRNDDRKFTMNHWMVDFSSDQIARTSHGNILKKLRTIDLNRPENLKNVWPQQWALGWNTEYVDSTKCHDFRSRWNTNYWHSCLEMYV